MEMTINRSEWEKKKNSCSQMQTFGIKALLFLYLIVKAKIVFI